MKIHVRVRRTIQAGDGIHVDHAEGNTLVTAKAADATDLESRVATLESTASDHESRIASLEAQLSGFVSTTVETCDGTIAVLAQ